MLLNKRISKNQNPLIHTMTTTTYVCVYKYWQDTRIREKASCGSILYMTGGKEKKLDTFREAAHIQKIYLYDAYEYNNNQNMRTNILVVYFFLVKYKWRATVISFIVGIYRRYIKSSRTLKRTAAAAAVDPPLVYKNV